MNAQRHVIKRQTVEITLAKQENAWQIQQTLSRIFQQSLPPLLDRCLSEASSPDYLHRIERLELDLGELDFNRLEAELLEKFEAALRLALSEQIAPPESMPTAAKQEIDPVSAHLELLELFMREGYLPWWADSSQRQLPEKSFTALINTAPNALARLLPKLIQEPRSLQRLISYFDDNHLLVIMALLCFAPQALVASLLQTLLGIQVQLQQLSRVSASHLRAVLWQSLLQMAIAGDPVIFRHAEFLTAVMSRWLRSLGLAQPILVSCLQQSLSSGAMRDNEWLPAVRTSVEQAATLMVEESALTIDRPLEFGSESAVAGPDAAVRESFVDRHRPIRNGYLRLKKTGGEYATQAHQSSPELLSEYNASKPSADESADLSQAKTLLTKNSSSVNEQTSADMPDTYTHEDFCSYPPSREDVGNTVDLSIAKPAPEEILAGMQDDCKDAGGMTPWLEQQLRATQGTVAEVEQHSERLPRAVEDLRGFKNLAGLTPSEFVHEGEEAHALKSTLLTRKGGLKSVSHDRLHATTDDRLTSAALSNRYVWLKKTIDNDARKPTDTLFVDEHVIEQSVHKVNAPLFKECALNNFNNSPLSLSGEGWGEGIKSLSYLVHIPKQSSTKNSSPPEEQTDIDTTSNSSAFCDTDALYINNAGLCLLWPYLASFFERLELVQNGRFHDQAAKQYAVSLLHYLAAEDLEPPEYLLPFNKLLCAMAIDEVFDLDRHLATVHIEACDELLAAVIDKAPILNAMSVSGFRGSFLLREGSLSAGEGSWLLRVERKTYDIVLDSFPWSWQWFKLPWMEHPLRVEW